MSHDPPLTPTEQDLYNNIESLGRQVGAIRIDLTDVKRVQEQHGKKLDELSGDVRELQKDVRGLQKDVTGLKTTVRRLDNKVDQLGTEMSEMKGMLRELLAR
ncbi:hypothetical protein [Longimycelium tulufanense]|nr:hypothetical protein [Longimycelium tulufanense]